MNQRDPSGVSKRSLSAVALALCIGAGMFGIMALLINSYAGPFLTGDPFGKNTWAGYLVITMVVIGISRSVYSKKVDQLQDSLNAEAIAPKYFKIAIRHLAISEAMTLLGVILFLLAGEFLFFIPIGLAWLEMVRIYLKIRSENNAPF